MHAHTPDPTAAAHRPHRVNRRWVRHSLAITLDTSLCPGARGCLSYLLSLPRAGFILPSVSAGLIASAFGKSVRTARRWLEALEDAEYLQRRQGRRRGQLVLLLKPKATELQQLREGDLLHRLKKEKPAIPRLSSGSRPIVTASKQPREERKKEAQEEGAGDRSGPAPALRSVAEQIAAVLAWAKESEPPGGGPPKSQPRQGIRA